MDDPRLSETQETGEGQSEVSEVARQLDEATYAPESQVEATGTFEQAEAIEATFVEVVQAVEEVDVADIPSSQPDLAPNEQSGDEGVAAQSAQAQSEADGFAETLPDDRVGGADGAPSELADPSQVPNLEDRLPQEGVPGQAGGRDGLPGGMGELPGGDLPGGMGEMPGGLPGMGEDMPGGLPGMGSDMPGDIRGGMGGGLPDGLGGEIPGGAGFGGIPGGDNPFGDPSGGMGGMGGIGGIPGGDMPGGGMPGGGMPGGGMPGGPGYGELMDGEGGGGGGGMFWSWNLNPGQQGRFERGRELTEFNEAGQDLNYEQDWDGGQEIGEKDMIDPFTGRYEEWGEATSSDYDEAEKDQENFAQAQRDMEEEKEKQKEAKDKRESDDDDDDDDDDKDSKESPQAQSGATSMTPDDGDGGGGGGGATIHEAGRFHWERLGGLLVFDPPHPDMGMGSDASSYDPSGTATMPVDEGGGGGAAIRAPEAGMKVDPSEVTDPDHEQAGKKAADKGA